MKSHEQATYLPVCEFEKLAFNVIDKSRSICHEHCHDENHDCTECLTGICSAYNQRVIITWFHPDLSSARDDRQTSSSAVWNIIDFLITQFIEFPAVRLLGNRNPLIPLMFEWVKDQVTIVSDVKPADQSKCSCTATNDLTIN